MAAVSESRSEHRLEQRLVTGLLPAGGSGRRLGRYGFTKELFPIVLRRVGEEPLEPRPLCDFAVDHLRAAGADRCVVVMAPEKTDLIRMLDASRQGMVFAYVLQSVPEGLPHAVALAAPWLGDSDVALALPDTLVTPPDALARVRSRLVRSSADLVLGVFPVEDPERLGPVDVEPDGTVARVYDKPGTRELMNSWGVAAWSPRFTDFCCKWDGDRRALGPAERVLGHVFEAARLAGLKVEAEVFAAGSMFDIGTPSGLRRALAELERSANGPSDG